MLADSQVIYDTVQTLEKYKSPKYFYIYSHRNKHTFAELESNFLDTSESSFGENENIFLRVCFFSRI